MAFLKLFSVFVIIFICFNDKILAKQDHRRFYMSGQDLSSDGFVGYDNFYNEKKYQIEDDPNFLNRWPWLRELVPPPNTNAENNLNVNPTDNVGKNNPNSFVAREKIFENIEENSPEPIPIPVAYTERRNMIKDRDEKRNNNNNYYMSLCHFKICNMGRKRNTRYLHFWNIMDKNTFVDRAAM